ncbi:hypothetical protein LMB56_04030 [Limosilactobacillus reuteri]|uniref:hypothetical protein n=1 Tax=Limosilactobacillus reuteri TaxID=1598 RepID=UPI001E2EFEC6|nr:hypothetical protein [Limosilactobacillus reuteri]MCC4435593.1 hypothetical protein [Limosilactobacillus reuteri]MCC4437962.1 hypothetical protein [Limosilactobacillus reuteri]MCC4441549.1 hypothetical protein [Limosilactobacillus reuteri]MCC4444661.1 hypothetical protein [Limosilactobacillus reuteri]MCC4445375.1 hypothetical protein [Limosilactobacillus reuteri]
MLTKNKKNSFKTQAVLMTLGTLAPMAPAMMSNFGNIVAHADSTAVPVPERLTTPSDEDFPLLPFTWTIKVVNQQNGQTLKTDDITFTPSKDYTIGKDGGTSVYYDIKDTANIFNKQHYQINNGDIDFNAILNGAKENNNGEASRRGLNPKNNDSLSNWVFGAKDSDGLTPYILPELNNNTTAKQTAEVSGTADHKVLTFYVIPNTAQTKNKTNNNSGSYVVPATGQDTGNNTATANGSNSTTNTSSNTNNGSATNNNSTNTNKTSNAGNSSQQSSQQDADTQQIINAINQHAVNSNDKLPSDAKLLEQAPSNTNGFNSYSVQVSEKGTNGQITYKHLTVHYNPATKQFFVTEQGQNTALTKAQLLQIFGLQSKDGNNVAGTNGVASSGNLGGTITGGSTGGLAQTNVQTKQNASILLSAIVGTAVLGFGLTKDGKLKL